MTSEREFLQRRLAIVDKRLGEPNHFDVDEKGRFYLRYQDSPSVEWELIREARLLKKLLDQVVEGKVSKTLQNWRKKLASQLQSHREFYLPVEQAHDAWLSLPFPTRMEIPEPPLPPDLLILDAQSLEWIVDEHLLKVLDDIDARLQKWLGQD